MNKCNQCNEVFNSEFKYCPKCDNKIKPVNISNKNAKKPKKQNSKLPLVISAAIVLIICIALFGFVQGLSQYSQGEFVSTKPSNSFLSIQNKNFLSKDSDVYQIA